MKKAIITGIIILLTLIVVLAGCGNDTKTLESEKKTETKTNISKTETTTTDTVTDNKDVTADVVKNTTPVTDTKVDDVVKDVVSEDVTAVDDVSNKTTTIVDNETVEDAKLTAKNFKVISIKNFKPYPADLTIKVGTTVEWKNINDNFNHIIAWNHIDVKADGLKPGQSWRYTFKKPGKITWFSTAKPVIQGIITVEE